MSYKDQLPKGIAERLVTVGEIADIAKVGPSAVSNWRRRFRNFPVPADTSPTGDLFQLSQVVAWLRSEGKRVEFSEPSIAKQLQEDWWKWSSSLSRSINPTVTLELLLQLLLIKKSSEVKGRDSVRQGWASLVASSDDKLIENLHEGLKRISQDEPSIGTALESSKDLGELDPVPLRHLVETIDQLGVQTSDTWSDIATETIEAVGRRLGSRFGEFSSPPDLVRLMIEILRPIEGQIYDPAFGAAMFLASAWRKGQTSGNLRLFGQERNSEAWRIGALHLALSGAKSDLAWPGDTLATDRHRDLKADRVALDTPLGSKSEFHSPDFDERWVFGVPPSQTGDLAWAQHVAWHLKEGGVGVMTCGPRGLSGGGRSEAIRRALIEADLIDAVIQLPPGIIASSNRSVALLVLEKGRDNRKGEILFLDARRLGKPERGGTHQLGSEDIERITKSLSAWRAGRFAAEAGLSGRSRSTRVISNDSDLMPNQYLSYLERHIQIDGVPIPEVLNRTRKEANLALNALKDSLDALQESLASIEVADDE